MHPKVLPVYAEILQTSAAQRALPTPDDWVYKHTLSRTQMFDAATALDNLSGNIPFENVWQPKLQTGVAPSDDSIYAVERGCSNADKHLVGL